MESNRDTRIENISGYLGKAKALLMESPASLAEIQSKLGLTKWQAFAIGDQLERDGYRAKCIRGCVILYSKSFK